MKFIFILIFCFSALLTSIPAAQAQLNPAGKVTRMASSFGRTCAYLEGTKNPFRCWGEYVRPDMQDYIKNQEFEFQSLNSFQVSDTNDGYFAILAADNTGLYELTVGYEWDKRIEKNRHPGISDAIVASKGTDAICGITASGRLECAWGSRRTCNSLGPEKCEPPLLNKPTEIKAGFSPLFEACAIGEEGLRCWGFRWMRPRPNYPENLKNPHSLASSYGSFCVIDEGQVKCWGYLHMDDFSPKAKTNPRQLVMGQTQFAGSYSFACAIFNEGPACWSKDGPAYFMPKLNNPSLLVSRSDHVCAKTDDGLVCWYPFPYANMKPECYSSTNPKCKVLPEALKIPAELAAPGGPK